MAHELGVVSASLGQLALHYGLVSPSEHEGIVSQLRAAAVARAPDSFARRLLRRGVAQQAVEHLLTLGASLGAVLCDACGEAVPQGELARRRPYPCPRCETLLFGFRAFAHGANQVEPDSADSEDTEPLPDVSPERPSRDTDRYDMVLPLPGQPQLAPGAGRAAFAETLRQRDPDMNQTVGFAAVFALPAEDEQLSDHQATQILEAMLDPPSGESPYLSATVKASARELGIEAIEDETLVASASDLGLHALPPLGDGERPRLPSRRSKRPEPEAEREPPLWPWIVALSVLCLATAIAMVVLVTT